MLFLESEIDIDYSLGKVVFVVGCVGEVIFVVDVGVFDVWNMVVENDEIGDGDEGEEN